MKNEKLILILAAIAACLMFWLLLTGCTLYVSVQGIKRAPVAPTISKTETVQKPKTHYQQLKDEHNTEWLNLPHREIDETLFEPK